MPYPLTDISLSLNTQALPNVQGLNLGGVDWIVFYNASPYAIKTSVGGAIHIIPAWYYYPIPTGGQALTQITALPYLQTIPGAGFTATLSTVLYLIGETPPSTFAQTLGGGPVDLTQATSVVNTNNPPATPFIFAEPVGDTNANGAVNINNQGQATFGDPTYNGSLALLGTASPVARLFVTNLIAALQLVDTNSNVDVDLESGSNILNGGTSGTAQIWTPFRGLWKITVIQLNNFKTGASNQLVNFPGIYSNRAFILATDCEGTELFKGGVAQGVRQWTSFGAAGSGGGTSPTTTWQGFNLLWLATGFDQIQFNSGWVSARNGVIFIVGS